MTTNKLNMYKILSLIKKKGSSSIIQTYDNIRQLVGYLFEVKKKEKKDTC